MIQQPGSKPLNAHFVIQPGWKNSGPHHWQTVWEQELGPAATRVPQHNWMVPECSAWTHMLAETIRGISAPVVILAHSAGSLAALFAAREVPVAAVVLVAPADAERPGAPPAIQSFTPIPMESLTVPALVIASDNDPYCSLKRARALAAAWKADLEIVHEGGHLNADAGFGPWPEGRLMVSAWLAHHGLLWPGSEEDHA